MNIKNFKEKIKPFEKDLILAVAIILVALISFGLGRLSKIGESQVPITIENISGSTSTPSAKNLTDKIFVASKNGTKYHYPWCSGAQSIKEENKIYFPQPKKPAKPATPRRQIAKD